MKVFDKLNSHLKHKLPFVLFAKPNSKKIVGLFQNNGNSNSTNIKNEDKGFVIGNFENNNLYLIPESQSEVIIEDFELFDSFKAEESKFFIEDTAFKKKIYTNLVKKGIDSIKNNAFEKVVLARKQRIYIQEINIIKTFENILFSFPDSFRYVYFHPKFGMWCGAFSEKLIKIDGITFETMALAGTQKCTNISNVKWQQKEIQEQQFVTDYITNALEDKVSEMVVSEPVTIHHGELCHIKTDISGKLNDDADVFSLLDILNPTPAVCGIPKDAAKDFILKNEKIQREFYSGVVGELNKDFVTNEDSKSELYVNLRCMKIEKDYVNLFVGAGITKDSDAEREWEETKNKTLAMRNCLA